MNSILDWVFNNKEWVFSGVGVAIAAALWPIFFKKKPTQQQTSGHSSTNYQAGGDINVNNKNDKR
jgi:hypothetical protein